MHETDTPGPTAADDTAVNDDGLDRSEPDFDPAFEVDFDPAFEVDFDRVTEALEALDADDLDTAEALVAGLDAVASTDPVAPADGDLPAEPT